MFFLEVRQGERGVAKRVSEDLAVSEGLLLPALSVMRLT
jgi:hypothetical protein